MKNVRKLLSLLVLASLLLHPLYSVSLSEKETARIENALEKSKSSLIQQEIVINQLSTELKKQSESYRKLKADKLKSNIRVGITCTIVGAVLGGAVGAYATSKLCSY